MAKPAAVVLLVLVLSGCVALPPQLMADAPDQDVPPAPPGKAQIVFMMPAYFAAPLTPVPLLVGYQPTIYAVTSGRPQLIGMLPPASKLVHMVDPGEHVFMIVTESENSACAPECPQMAAGAPEFLPATVLVGRTYYAYARRAQDWGDGWKPRFVLQPVRVGTPDADANSAAPLSKLIVRTGYYDVRLSSEELSLFARHLRSVENTAASEQWSRDNRDAVARKYDASWRKWQTRLPAERASRTLKPDDGRP
jgi:hypothetical protein